jgi:(1->4)-alpha-D-glucan 1-alpha-D-glucosylmutase
VLREFLAHAPDGRAKFWVIWRALQLRQAQVAFLRHADYVPLEVRGERAANAVAFARRRGSALMIVVGTRLSTKFGLAVGAAPIGEVWGDTAVFLPESGAPSDAARPRWLTDALSGAQHGPLGAELRLADILREFPVATLFGEANGPHEPPP